jgi:hypothetical protein
MCCIALVRCVLVLRCGSAGVGSEERRLGKECTRVSRSRRAPHDEKKNIISLFTAQHVSNVSTSIFRSLRLVVDLCHVLYCSGSMCRSEERRVG